MAAAEGLAGVAKAAEAPGTKGSSRLYFLVIVFMFWFSSYIYVPVLSPYVEHLGASYVMVGAVLGIYGLMQILFRLPIGMGSDVLNRRRPFIYLGLIASGASCLLFLAGAHPGWALAARAVSGIAASAWVVYSVMFAGYFPKEEAGRAMGMLQFTTVIAQLTSMMISGYIVDHFGWNTPFIIGGIVAVAAMLLVVRLPEQQLEKRTAIKLKDLAGVVKEPLLVKVSLLSVLAHCVLFITMFGYTPNQALYIGASKSRLADAGFYAASCGSDPLWSAPVRPVAGGPGDADARFCRKCGVHAAHSFDANACRLMCHTDRKRVHARPDLPAAAG